MIRHYVLVFGTDIKAISGACISNLNSRNFGQKFLFNVHRLYSVVVVIHARTHINAPKATSPRVCSPSLMYDGHKLHSWINFLRKLWNEYTIHACTTVFKSMAEWIFICVWFGLLFLRIVEFCVTIWFAYRKIQALCQSGAPSDSRIFMKWTPHYRLLVRSVERPI